MRAHRSQSALREEGFAAALPLYKHVFIACSAIIGFFAVAADSSAQVSQCNPTQLPATFAFTQPQQLVDYLNSLPTSLMPARTTGIDGANPRPNTATMAKICDLKGYTAVVSSFSTEADSCEDNTLVEWNGSQFVWTRNNSCALGSWHLHRLTCGTPKPVCPSNPQPPQPPSAGPPECGDGIDNDGDGMIDALTTGGNPNAVATLGLGNPFAIRAIVNAGGYGIPDNGAIFRDAASVNKVCQIQGYVAASGSDCTAPPYDNRCGWRSFGDNTMWAWNGSSFYSIRNNVWTSTVTCVGLPGPCADRIDNDGDGKIDLADTGCVSASDGSEVAHDPQCASAAGASEGILKQCKDRIDNDGDGRTDFDGGDPGCANGDDDDESDDPVPMTCPTDYTCGLDVVVGGAPEVCAKDGKNIEWSTGDEECTLPTGAPGECYKCVDPPDDGGNAGGGGDDDDDDDDDADVDPPPMCPIGCNVDADCGEEPQCAKEQNADGTYTGNDKCWLQDDVCVRKCKVPRCIDNKCSMAAPADIPTAPYLPCEGVSACPAPRCGDGVVQPAPDQELPVPDDDLPKAASLVRGSGLLATSISNACGEGLGYACSSSFVERFCGPGDGCFALVGANSLYQRCLPADCDSRRNDADCNIVDTRWSMCPGTAVPPDDGGEQDPNEPVGEPVPEDGEECDDGNNDGNDGCSPSCKKEICGDGAVQAKGADGKPNTADDEVCDDGNRTLGDGCSNTCKEETCGNGTIEYGEECDDGNKNSDTEPAACRTNCMLPKCNDGVVDVWKDNFGLDEQCDCGPEFADFDWEANKDDPMSAYCEVEFEGKPAICHVGNCQISYCGDGMVFNAGQDRKSGTEDDEMCDAGPFNSDGLPEGAECENAAQCGGLPCVEGKCKEVFCSDDNGCDDGLSCIKGACRPGGCSTNDDCKAGETCDVHGNCSSCTVDTDCASGQCHPNGLCASVDQCKDGGCEPSGYGCRMDCKMARCGDGIVDKEAGETCDEGEAMFKCNGFPQPACDCGIPSWGSHEPGVGPFNTTCCPEGQYCSVWPTATCPSDCGVSSGDDGTGGRGMCGNHRLEAGEECDTSVPGYVQGVTEPADAQVAYIYRPNRDGTQTAFVSDDGKWKPRPMSIERKYTTIDHAPQDGASPDAAYILSSGGTARTYFHLWDIPLAGNTQFTDIRIRVGADFTGAGTAWKAIEVAMQLTSGLLSPADMNAAVLEIVGDETAHTLTFRLLHSTTGRLLAGPQVVNSPIQVTGAKSIAVDAAEVMAFGTSLDASYLCNSCALVRCGNKIVDPGESCDDGNAEGGDGCSERCEEEICKLPGA